MYGKVFNIERYHYTDGTGIRILVFLKGCTLSCPWCSNPESQSPRNEMAFNANKCLKCGRCIPACPNGAISLKDGEIVTDRKLCTSCGACVDRCFYDARTLFGRDMTVDQVMTEVLKDKNYFVRSKGGVTFSGGEAALQPEFVRECIRRCRLEFINTAIETAGAVPWEMLYRAVEHAGEILFDLKTLDDRRFKEFSSYPTAHILENLQKLCSAGKKVRIRCPIIPGVNKDQEFISQVIGIAKENHIRQIDLLPFHQLGSYKYRTIGREYTLGDLKTMNKEEVSDLEKLVRNAGLDCVVGG